MILEALTDYYGRLRERGDVPPPGYSEENVSFSLVLDQRGNLVFVRDLRDTAGKTPRARRLTVPQGETRTSGVRAQFLWDKSAYVLGVSTKQSERTEKEHEAFKALHRELLAETDDPGLGALLAFLEAWKPSHFQPPAFSEDMLDANFVFELDGERQFLHDRTAARALQARQLEGADADPGPCLVTGDNAPIARLHPSIKGVDGAQSSGAAIVSFNLDAFQSYAKTQGENAPVSEYAAFAYTTALNHLLRRSEHNRQRLRIGDTTVVFWAEAAESDQAERGESLFAAFMNPTPTDEQEQSKLLDLLTGLAKGQPLADLEPGLDPQTRFCVLGLAPNASRLSVRFWLRDSLDHFIDRLAQHYRDLHLEPTPWQTLPGTWRLLRTVAAQEKTENIPPQLAGEVLRAVLNGTRYPRTLLTNVLMRMRSDKGVSGLRAAICKAVIVRDQRLSPNTGQEGIPVSLDTESTNVAYRLGRLFAALESAQRTALGGHVNATIRDRYFGSASATPAAVFPVLLRGAQHHLGRLRKDKPGLAVTLEREIGEIVDGLDSEFPRTMNIEDQGRFAIGYYHQSQARFSGKSPEATNPEEGEEA